MILPFVIALAAPEASFAALLRDALVDRAKEAPFDIATDQFKEWKKQHDLDDAIYQRCLTLRAVDRMAPQLGKPERVCTPPLIW